MTNRPMTTNPLTARRGAGRYYRWTLFMTDIAAVFGVTVLLKGDGGVIVPVIAVLAGALAFAVLLRGFVDLRASQSHRTA